MRRRNSGFSILEIIIALAIVMLVLAAATTFFITTVRQYKIQTKLVETNIEGNLGLELLRQDLESLGFGLPWDNFSTAGEATTILDASDEITLRAVVSLNYITTGALGDNSDRVVIRSTRVGMGSAAGKWTTLQANGFTRRWGSTTDDPEEDLQPADRVIVLSPTLNHWTLVTPAAGALYSNVKDKTTYAPADNLTVTNIIYGVDNIALKFPWNRADYYIDYAITKPQRCAPNTGVLVKRVVSHEAGEQFSDPLPLLDCAADMQVIYGLDINGDKAVVWENDISDRSAETIRTQLVEVRLFILAQQGQRDDTYSNSQNPILVGFNDPVLGIRGRSIDVGDNSHYRWKVYSIVVKPRNLAN